MWCIQLFGHFSRSVFPLKGLLALYFFLIGLIICKTVGRGFYRNLYRVQPDHVYSDRYSIPSTVPEPVEGSSGHRFDDTPPA